MEKSKTREKSYGCKSPSPLSRMLDGLPDAGSDAHWMMSILRAHAGHGLPVLFMFKMGSEGVSGTYKNSWEL